VRSQFISLLFLAVNLLLCDRSVYAQTGPGGVGNASTNFLWLSADHGVTAPMAGVTNWADRSGNANHSAQANAMMQPVIVPNSINGYPALVFDNDPVNPDFLAIPDNASLEGMNGLTGFAVFDLNAGTPITAPRGILSKRNSPDSQNAYGWFLWNSGSNVAQHLDIDGTGNRISGGNHSPGTIYLNAFAYHGASPTNSQDQVLYTGHSAVGNGIESSSSIPNYSSDLYIGILRGHTGTGTNATRFNGRIGEVILYNQTLNAVEITIVHNYLAAKYGTSLSTLDLFTMDDPANGNYDHDVAGIGRNSSVQHTDSRGSGIIRISNASNLDVNESLFWGHDNGALGAWGVMDYPEPMQGRLDRVWRVSEVTSTGAACDVGSITMTFDLSELGTVSATDLRLLVDADNDGLFSDETPISGAVDLGGGQFQFTGVTAIANGRRFTVGTMDIRSTPLPIELLAFTAVAEEHSVRLDWTTASEQDNAYFHVQRSSDLENWQVVSERPGSRTSNSPLDYSTYDTRPMQGISYYRLQQTDMNGTSKFSAVVPMYRTASDEVVIYPVPFDDVLMIDTGTEVPLSLQLFNAAGQHMPIPVVSHAGASRMDTSGLPAGSYVLSIRTERGSFTRSILKQ
jgi:hypothetical protein